MTAERLASPTSPHNAEATLAEVYSQERPRLVTVARINGGGEDAEDAVQEGAISALLSIRSNSYRENGKLQGYLTRTVINKAIDTVRKRKKLAAPLPEESENFIADRDKSLDPERLALNNEEIRVVGEAVEKLPPRQRDVVILWSRGLTYEEISSTLGVTEITSRVALSRARKKLKTLLSDPQAA